MYENKFLQVNDLGVLHFRARQGSGALVFRVLFRQVRPFKFGNVGYSISSSSGYTKRLGGTFAGRTIEDLFYYEDSNTLVHVVLDVFPRVMIYPYWTPATLQGDYIYGATKLPAREDADWGWLEPPVEFMVVPKVNLDFRFYNPYGTETLNPYVKFWYGEYEVQWIKDVPTIRDVLAKRYRPEPKWFTIYGFRLIDYDFKDALKTIDRPIPVNATEAQIRDIVSGWG